MSPARDDERPKPSWKCNQCVRHRDKQPFINYGYHKDCKGGCKRAKGPAFMCNVATANVST